MDSPPSSSTWSEAAFMLSDDSGLLLTSGSVSSGSVSGESRSGRYKLNMELLESDGEDKSLSQADSLDGMSDGMCGENFNTLKKGPTSNWCEMLLSPKIMASIDPPPEFQDDPIPVGKLHCSLPIWLDKLANHLMKSVLEDALAICCKITWSIQCSQDCHAIVTEHRPRYHNMMVPRLCWTPELFPYSPCHANRPNSRNSLTPSRLSSSHNSLNLTSSNRVDDSNFITQAVSHDALLSGGGQISDIYNVPFDSDIYAMPIDMVRPRTPPRRRDKQFKYQRRRRRNVSAGSQFELAWHVAQVTQFTGKPRAISHVIKSQALLSDVCSNGKRHSVPGTAVPQPETEPIHMTLQEVRQYLQTLYSSSSDSSDNKNHKSTIDNTNKFENNVTTILNGESTNNNTSTTKYGHNNLSNNNNNNNRRKNNKKNTFVINMKNKTKIKDTTPTKTTSTSTITIASTTITTPTTTTATATTTVADIKQNNNNNNNISSNNNNNNENSISSHNKQDKRKKSPARTFSSNLKHTICNFFRFRKISSSSSSPEHIKREIVVVDEDDENNCDSKKVIPVQKRALPPLPSSNNEEDINDDAAELSMDFATNIEKVKNYGWYWGPISAEAAEKILSNEPEGSFIVRDSSDDHYIFSLSFKLNGCVRHVRIENYQGNFSFGSCTKFKSHTIVEFIENAVEHSRSGRYLFFLHRRPVLGPMRVQLLHPVSRFKQVQSLQHMCRFVILKLVRRDLVGELPLPRRIIDYLRMKHYYSELLSESEESEGSGTGADYKRTTTATSTPQQGYS